MTDAPKDRTSVAAGLVAGGLIVLLWGLTAALVFREIPTSNREPLLILLGIVSTNFGIVVGYYFGSSIANRKKDDTISTALTQVTAPDKPASDAT